MEARILKKIKTGQNRDKQELTMTRDQPCKERWFYREYYTAARRYEFYFRVVPLVRKIYFFATTIK